MKSIVYFGETVPGYEVKVFNEREVRASAGILFFFAMLSSMNAWFTGNTGMMRWFIVAFLIDFSIRLVVNPKYAPTMILGRIAVSNQTPEYSGAVQKRFAWGLGWGIAAMMFVFVVLLGFKGPFLMVACVTCLTLMFFETAFGICIGCKLYNLFNKGQATLCPGGACAMKVKHEIQNVHVSQLVVVSVFVLAMVIVPLTTNLFATTVDAKAVEMNAGAAMQECVIPKWVTIIGHEQMYRDHHSCQ